MCIEVAIGGAILITLITMGVVFSQQAPMELSSFAGSITCGLFVVPAAFTLGAGTAIIGFLITLLLNAALGEPSPAGIAARAGLSLLGFSLATGFVALVFLALGGSMVENLAGMAIGLGIVLGWFGLGCG